MSESSVSSAQEAHDLNLEHYGECPECGEYGSEAIGDPCAAIAKPIRKAGWGTMVSPDRVLSDDEGAALYAWRSQEGELLYRVVPRDALATMKQFTSLTMAIEYFRLVSTGSVVSA